MTKQSLTLLSILLSAGLLHAQSSDQKPKAAATPDINKMIQSATAKGGASSSVVALKDPVAVVNGEKITKADLEKTFKEALAASGADATALSAEQKLQGYRQILDGMIMEKLVDKQAANIQVSKEEIDAQLAKIKKQFPSEEVFLGEMKKSGLTYEQFTANLTRSMRQSKWMQSQIQGKDSATEDDAKKFYDANTKEFTNPDLVKASHILFLTPQGASPEQLKAAENKAKSAIIRANKGEPFPQLATELSEEPGAKERGGDLGYFPKDRMVPEFADAAFAQKVGTVSATPVKTKFGYHVIKVTEKKPAGTATFAEAKDQIMAFIQAQKRREVLKGVMQELRQAAKIEVNLPGPASAPAPAK
jgi:peptidyl-prolyl cis-trans isomerase C